MDSEELTDLAGELTELTVLAENGALSEEGIGRIMCGVDQETCNSIKRAIVNHPEWIAEPDQN